MKLKKIITILRLLFIEKIVYVIFKSLIIKSSSEKSSIIKLENLKIWNFEIIIDIRNYIISL